MTPLKKHHYSKLVRRWHRRIGILAAAFAMLLAVTGLLLNHTEGLKLSSRYVQSNLLLKWYDITVPDPVSYAVDDHWVSQLGERLYFDNQEIPAMQGKLIGAVRLPDKIIAAIEGRLLLLDLSGRLLEILGVAEGVPPGISAIGVLHGNLAVRASHADFLADKEILHWEESEKEEAHIPLEADWAKPAAPPRTLSAQLAEAYRGKGLSLERVLLDLHSGRIAGKGGEVAVDVVSALILLLAISGIWLWIKHERFLK